MKENSHPKYQDVLFIDSATNRKYIIGTTLQPSKTEVHNGVEYPVCYVPISSSSHPYFLGGQQQYIDTEGRVDKFKKRYQAAKEKVVAQKASEETVQDKKTQKSGKSAAASKKKTD